MLQRSPPHSLARCSCSRRAAAERVAYPGRSSRLGVRMAPIASVGRQQAKTIGGTVKVVNCPCGERIEGETDNAVVERVNEHLATAHPEMAGKYSDEQILSMASEQ
jgi:hypothetical protein